MSYFRRNSKKDFCSELSVAFVDSAHADACITRASWASSIRLGWIDEERAGLDRAGLRPETKVQVKHNLGNLDLTSIKDAEVFEMAEEQLRHAWLEPARQTVR